MARITTTTAPLFVRIERYPMSDPAPHWADAACRRAVALGCPRPSLWVCWMSDRPIPEDAPARWSSENRALACGWGVTERQAKSRAAARRAVNDEESSKTAVEAGGQR